MHALIDAVGFAVLLFGAGLSLIIVGSLLHEHWSWHRMHRRGQPTRRGGTEFFYTSADLARATTADTLDELWVKLADEGGALRIGDLK